MADAKMNNPYEAIYTAKATAIIAGARTDASPNVGELHERLTEMAFYLCENQKTGADAMFGMDLLEAARQIRKASKSP